MPRPARTTARRTSPLRAALLAVVLAVGTLGVVSAAPSASGSVSAPAKAKRANVVTPGNFTGLGFDQCHAPSQAAMDAWMQNSPFRAVGIYIDGASRFCREQPNLTPQWISTQLAAGWALLPITLGPQASCQPRFPRWGNDPTIDPTRDPATGTYAAAYNQGVAQASQSVAVAGGLGIVAGSTLWYDLEGFNMANTPCRESALSFLSGWTTQIRALGYVSGVYSSAGSGIKMLDNARVNRPSAFALPDQIWIARWDGIQNTSTSYIRSDGWPNARVKQFQGGHNETYGGVTINIDRNYLQLGTGAVAPREINCGGVRLVSRAYAPLRPASASYVPAGAQVKALQCLLQQHGLYNGKVHGRYGKATVAAINAWQTAHGQKVRTSWGLRNWVTLLSAGDTPVVKFGSTGPAVRRLQRALVAAGKGSAESRAVRATGVFDPRTTAALRAWQKKAKVHVTGVAGTETWAAIQAGRL
ncbi:MULTISPECIES: glycoside hydrolase domain-containing protein [unclassified Nocardioides]|uniref:glycoside hydrolase domain-containing protein n=1 Tax=unclassified Nocardioides TaxID=2615069 RepID=UPI003612D40D